MGMQGNFKAPEYNLSLVNSCDQCPSFPVTNSGTNTDELRSIVRDEIRKILEEMNKSPSSDRTQLADLFRDVFSK